MTAYITCNTEEPVKLPQYRAAHKVSVQFKNLFYTATSGLFSRKKKTILKGVNGEFKAGEFTALLGTSGAGKSSLLNILTGYISLGVDGDIFDNGELRDPKQFSKLCSYIMQDDKLYPLLKVQEAMNFAADLNLPSTVSWEEKQKRIEIILKSLGIYQCRSTFTSQLSGGQKRRLSIGIELIHNPPVIFLDEPTSGLDDVTAKQIINLLSSLAKDGRTVICTIHQPSALILEKFDHIYCLVDGKCTYQGTLKGLLPYLASFNPPLICPNYHNPADYLLEVCRGMYGNVYEAMVHKCANGVVSVREHVTDLKKEAFDGNHNELSLYDNMKHHDIYATSFFYQMFAIMKRVYLMMTRDKQFTFYRFFLHTVTGIFVGILYYQIGNDGRYTLDNFNYIFFTFLFVMYISFFSMLVTFAEELPIITQEHFNGWYSIKSYLVAVTIADLPIQLAATLIYIAITYYMTGQPLESFRFNIFVLTCFLNSIVSQAFGMLFSSYLKLKISVVIGPVAMIPFIVFCGYFIHMKDAAYYTYWAFDASYMRYALEGSIQGIMGFDRGKFECPGLYCHFVYPYTFMEQIGMGEPRLVLDICVLVGYYVIMKIVGYLALVNRIGSRK